MTGPSFSAGVNFTYKAFINWTWFLAEDAEVGQAVEVAFGKTPVYWGVPQRIEFVLSWLTVIFIAIGVLITIVRFKTMVTTSQAEQNKAGFLIKKLEAEYLILGTACSIILVAMVILPFVSRYYGEARTHFQMMVPLSLFFVIGGITVAQYLKARPYWVILIVLIPYFLSTSGAMTQVFGFPRAITLNSTGPLYHQYIFDAESYAAKWLAKYSEEEVPIHSNSLDTLLSQGKIPGYGIPGSRLSGLRAGSKVGGYIYLRRLDIEEGLVAEYPATFDGKSKIYSSGQSEVYR